MQIDENSAKAMQKGEARSLNKIAKKQKGEARSLNEIAKKAKGEAGIYTASPLFL